MTQMLTNDLDLALLKLRSQAGDLTELSGTDLSGKAWGDERSNTCSVNHRRRHNRRHRVRDSQA